MKHFCEVFQWSSIYVRISLLSDVFILKDASLYELKKKIHISKKSFCDIFCLISVTTESWKVYFPRKHVGIFPSSITEVGIEKGLTTSIVRTVFKCQKYPKQNYHNLWTF